MFHLLSTSCERAWKAKIETMHLQIQCKDECQRCFLEKWNWDNFLKLIELKKRSCTCGIIHPNNCGNKTPTNKHTEQTIIMVVSHKFISIVWESLHKTQPKIAFIAFIHFWLANFWNCYLIVYDVSWKSWITAINVLSQTYVSKTWKWTLVQLWYPYKLNL